MANTTLKPWEVLTPRTQYRAWQAGDPRVPPGWEPPDANHGGKGRRVLPWEELSARTRVAYFKKGDPRVPKGWAPPGKTAAEFGIQPKRRVAEWENIPTNRRVKLFEQGDPRVPEGWVPPPKRDAPSYFTAEGRDEMSRQREEEKELWWRQVQAYHKAEAAKRKHVPKYESVMRYPEAICVELTPALLELPEGQLWTVLKTSWQEALLSPKRVCFRVKGRTVLELDVPK